MRRGSRPIATQGSQFIPKNPYVFRDLSRNDPFSETQFELHQASRILGIEPARPEPTKIRFGIWHHPQHFR
jgi:hypothetical protein